MITQHKNDTSTPYKYRISLPDAPGNDGIVPGTLIILSKDGGMDGFVFDSYNTGGGMEMWVTLFAPVPARTVEQAIRRFNKTAKVIPQPDAFNMLALSYDVAFAAASNENFDCWLEMNAEEGKAAL